jgi:hypothetical protein
MLFSCLLLLFVCDFVVPLNLKCILHPLYGKVGNLDLDNLASIILSYDHGDRKGFCFGHR